MLMTHSIHAQAPSNATTFESSIECPFRRKTRQWTPEEDERLRAATAILGTTKWQIIAQFVGNGRNQSQCSQRWQRVLDPKLKKTHWTEDEDAKLEQLIKEHGTQRWMKIASIFGDRSDVQCRYRYQQLRRSSSKFNHLDGSSSDASENSESSSNSSPEITPKNDLASFCNSFGVDLPIIDINKLGKSCQIDSNGKNSCNITDIRGENGQQRFMLPSISLIFQDLGLPENQLLYI
ncbi:hypothetical protein TRFO_13427 [Tritrichomonas foetus]|uniref:Myb-like DNA-binding domain containing protein n=1 Tax=Tritrichomonas foetus TaxID=1144522 RepID=A0A1J4KXY3_9EUKA|nr:hypothetical protein TRFO_13427 [Tritrichomonas foetus]|eukprot:OHT16107.1 hypothetical protein TRFO_13427 [Tritrichomonas foetus]